MNTAFEPAYLALQRSGELQRRVERACKHLENCNLCPHYCHINRRETVRGAVCRTGEKAVVHNFGFCCISGGSHGFDKLRAPLNTVPKNPHD